MQSKYFIRTVGEDGRGYVLGAVGSPVGAQMMWAGRCGGGKRYCRSISPSDKAMAPWARHTSAASVLGSGVK